MYELFHLKCNGMQDPQGLSDLHPIFSWKAGCDKCGVNQAAYCLKVWEEEECVAWESGWVQSEDFRAAYGGASLKSHTRYLWQVCVQTDEGEEVSSEWQEFTMGILKKEEWRAKWIEADVIRKPAADSKELWKMFAGLLTSDPHPEAFLNPPICFRKQIDVRKKVKKAYLYATAHGSYDIKINGSRITENLLEPGYTVYEKYLEVQQYDVKRHCGEGTQIVDVILADGWYTGKIGLAGIGDQYGKTNACYLQLELFYEDEDRETIISDESFQWTTGPYEYADLFVGERYQQQKERLEHWKCAIVRDYGTGQFRGIASEPVVVLRRIMPVRSYQSPDGCQMLDFGENIAGFLHLVFEGKKGMEVRLLHCEETDREGNYLDHIMGQNKNQMDVYCCSRDGVVDYTPMFTFHGFRYVKVEGISMDQIKAVEACVIGTRLAQTGHFLCSNPLINRLQENIFRSQQGNMISIPTDCPQRERAGWTGDMQIYAPTACFNMDVEGFLSKWLCNMYLEQLPDGQIPNVIPDIDSNRYINKRTSEHVSSSGWADACIIIPYVLYQKYGRKAVLEDNFKMMEQWMEYVKKRTHSSFPKPIEAYTKEQLERQKYLWNTDFHFGDWLLPSLCAKGVGDPVRSAELTKEYTATAFYAYMAQLMAEICSILDKKRLADEYRELNHRIKQAYAGEYIREDGTLVTEYQGLYVLTLQMGLVPKTQKKQMVSRLKELIHKNGDLLDTGFVSVPFLLDVLCDCGEKELAYRLLYQEKNPSWLYEVKMGATTIWESWNAILPDGTRTKASYNHFAFGCVGDFIYRRILGLWNLEPGYKKVLIEPDMNAGITHAKGSYESVYGRIEIEWRKEGTESSINIVLPPNTSGILKWDGKEVELVSGHYRYNGICV